MRTYTLLLFCLLLSLLPVESSAEWSPANRGELLRPLECSYRILSAQATPGNYSVVKYYVYPATNFSKSEDRSVGTQTIEINFEVSKAQQAGLIEFIKADEKPGFGDLINSYDLSCNLTLTGEYSRQRRRGFAEISALLFCSYSAESDGTAQDLSALYQLDISKIALQKSC